MSLRTRLPSPRLSYEEEEEEEEDSDEESRNTKTPFPPTLSDYSLRTFATTDDDSVDEDVEGEGEMEEEEAAEEKTDLTEEEEEEEAEKKEEEAQKKTSPDQPTVASNTQLKMLNLASEIFRSPFVGGSVSVCVLFYVFSAPAFPRDLCVTA